MYFRALIFLGFLEAISIQATNGTQNPGSILLRRKRYLAFPEGSSFSAAICTTIGVIGNPAVEFLSWAINWGVSYDLPNQTWVHQHANGLRNDMTNTKHVLQRRYRRELYNKVELVIDRMGFNGQACIARTLCETSKYFSNQKGNMVEEILKTIFRFPKSRVQSHEPQVIHTYDRIYRKAPSISDCSVTYSECRFSLYELAFGKYSVEASKSGIEKFISFSYM